MDPETRLYLAKFSIAEGHRQAQLERAARPPRPVSTKPATRFQLSLARLPAPARRRLRSRPQSIG
ncbi:MAG: hypothetical protein H0X16_01730 [Chloroflexi bacterium]|nr:hypothetical protein [Chloroflexota bacterium]